MHHAHKSPFLNSQCLLHNNYENFGEEKHFINKSERNNKTSSSCFLSFLNALSRVPFKHVRADFHYFQGTVLSETKTIARFIHGFSIFRFNELCFKGTFVLTYF